MEEVTGMSEIVRRPAEQNHASEHVYVPGRVRVGPPGDGEPGEDDS